jgi:hypothetical protein
MREQILRDFCVRLNRRFLEEVWKGRMTRYRRKPEAFARRALESLWWEKQREVAESVAHHRRTAVKSANGVGKTYLAADLALWFLYCYQPSVVLTTAPTRRQVRHLHTPCSVPLQTAPQSRSCANARPQHTGARPPAAAASSTPPPRCRTRSPVPDRSSAPIFAKRD